MITIHEKTAQKFDTLGLGALLPGSCVVKEELNGSYELKMSHSYDKNGKWKRIERGRIIYAPTKRGMQPFRIYNVKPTMKGITVNARHIFYDLLDNQCSEISFDGTASGALEALQGAFAFAMPFSFATDISVSGEMTTGRMNPVQVLLSDDEETTSFVKGFGGELLRDGFNVSLLTAMGQDRDVAIRYGKNLVGLEVTEDEADVKTRIQYHGSDGSGTLDSPFINEYVYPKIHLLEDENKTKAELKAEAQALFDGGIDIPLVNIKVDFIVLADTVEYADYAPLEEVFLGDIVTIINQKMNFSKKARVISYEWDCLLERYNEVELGDFMPTLASSVTSGVRSGSLASSAAVTSSALAALLNSHMKDFSNPHKVTAAQTGGSSSGSSDTDALLELLAEHEENKENPHNVTADQTGAYSKEEVDRKIEDIQGTVIISGVDEPTDNIGNNGDLYLKIASGLKHTEIEFLECTGPQFFNIENKPNQDTRVVVDIEISASTKERCIFGARKAYREKGFGVFAGTNNVGYQVDYGASSTNTTGIDSSGRHKIELNKNVFSVDGTIIHTAAYSAFQCDYTMFLLSYSNAGNAMTDYPIAGKLYSCQVYTNGIQKNDLIPVKDVNDVPCLYDKLSNLYIYNVGSGAFSVGAEIRQVLSEGSLWLKQNGTWTQVLKGAT